MMTKGFALVAVTTTMLATAGCQATNASVPEPTPVPGAVAVAQVPGKQKTTVELTDKVTDFAFTVSCQGKGTLSYEAHSGGGDFVGTIACPGSIDAPGVSAPAGSTVSLEVNSGGAALRGILQLAPARS